VISAWAPAPSASISKKVARSPSLLACGRLGVGSCWPLSWLALLVWLHCPTACHGSCTRRCSGIRLTNCVREWAVGSQLSPVGAQGKPTVHCGWSPHPRPQGSVPSSAGSARPWPVWSVTLILALSGACQGAVFLSKLGLSSWSMKKTKIILSGGSRIFWLKAFLLKR